MAAPAEVATLLLTETADVYARSGGTTGAFTTLVASGVKCRLLHLNTDVATGAGRTELAARRKLVFDAAYTLPRYAQIEVNGLRWNPVAEFETLPWLDGTPAYKRVDVQRAPA
jgi:hypothetical protein